MKSTLPRMRLLFVVLTMAVAMFFTIGSSAEAWFFVMTKIDLKPGSNPNCVNPDSRGRVAVAIFSTDDFDATTVDPFSVQFSGAVALRCKLEDALMEGPTWVFTQDGLLDLVCHFRTNEVSWPADGSDCGTLELTGQSLDGTPIQGADTACLPGENTCNTSTPIPVP